MFVIAIKDERGALVSEHRLEDTQLVLGRSSEADIQLTGDGISRQHACLFIESGQVYVADMGSANGVYVNEQKLRREALVDDTTRIRIARFLIQVEPMEPNSASLPGINTAVVQPGQAHAKLLILSGDEAGRELLLFEPIVAIGRIEENDLCIQHPSMSRHHGRIHQQDDGSYIVQDLDSSNGIFVAGRKINRPTRLLYGDRVSFGAVECLLSKTEGVSSIRFDSRQWILVAALAMASAAFGVLAALIFGGE